MFTSISGIQIQWIIQLRKCVCLRLHVQKNWTLFLEQILNRKRNCLCCSTWIGDRQGGRIEKRLILSGGDFLEKKGMDLSSIVSIVSSASDNLSKEKRFRNSFLTMSMLMGKLELICFYHGPCSSSLAYSSRRPRDGCSSLEASFIEQTRWATSPDAKINRISFSNSKKRIS